MTKFNNSDNHRVCDVSEDKRFVIIERKGCVTRITANSDGTLNLENLPKTA